MKKKVLAMIAVAIMTCNAADAAPMQNPDKGKAMLDIGRSIHSFEGGKVVDGGFSIGLDKNWSMSYRHTNFHPDDWGTRIDTKYNELNLNYKYNDNLQLYAGYSRTKGNVHSSGQELDTRNTFQAGVIGFKKLSPDLTLFASLGGGDNVANVEFGLTKHITPQWDATLSYRHLSVEKIGPAGLKENLRSFAMGVSYKL